MCSDEFSFWLKLNPFDSAVSTVGTDGSRRNHDLSASYAPDGHELPLAAVLVEFLNCGISLTRFMVLASSQNMNHRSCARSSEVSEQGRFCSLTCVDQLDPSIASKARESELWPVAPTGWPFDLRPPLRVDGHGSIQICAPLSMYLPPSPGRRIRESS